MAKQSAGQLFRYAVAQEKPLQVVGTINANHALLAKRAGYKAIYLSGGGVAAGSLGLPDLGISNLDDVLTMYAVLLMYVIFHYWSMRTQALVLLHLTLHVLQNH